VEQEENENTTLGWRTASPNYLKSYSEEVQYPVTILMMCEDRVGNKYSKIIKTYALV